MARRLISARKFWPVEAEAVDLVGEEERQVLLREHGAGRIEAALAADAGAVVARTVAAAAVLGVAEDVDAGAARAQG